MKVTDLDYYIDDRKLEKLNFLCQRVSGVKKFQNVIISDGKEGEGKSTITAGDAYYIGYTLRRKVTLFFDIDAMNEYSLLPTTKDEIIIWDDAALAALSLEAYNDAIVKLIKILMLARKKRNTYYINIQELFRLKEPLVSRATGMNHVYSPDGLTLGKFTWLDENKVRFLYDYWKRSKRKAYKRVWNIRGSFTNVLYKVFDEEEYEKLKDKAILSIKSTTKTQEKAADFLVRARYLISILPNMTNAQKVEFVKPIWGKISTRTLEDWKKIGQEAIRVSNGSTGSSADGEKKNRGMYIRPKDESYLTLPKNNILSIPKTQNKQKENEEYD